MRGKIAACFVWQDKKNTVQTGQKVSSTWLRLNKLWLCILTEHRQEKDQKPFFYCTFWSSLELMTKKHPVIIQLVLISSCHGEHGAIGKKIMTMCTTSRGIQFVFLCEASHSGSPMTLLLQPTLSHSCSSNRSHRRTQAQKVSSAPLLYNMAWGK